MEYQRPRQKGKHPEDRLNNISIHLPSTLIELGSDLLLPNKQGIRALDLMEARKLHANKNEYTQGYNETLGIMLAFAQAIIMDQDTPAAKGSMRGMPRL